MSNFRTKTIKISKLTLDKIRIIKYGQDYSMCSIDELLADEWFIKREILDYSYKNNNFDLDRNKRIDKLKKILKHLKSVKNINGFTLEDNIKSIREVKENIKYINDIKLNIYDTTEMFICKLYLLLNYTDLKSLLRRLSIKLINVRSYKFNSKNKYYSRAKEQIIFCREDYSKYNYGNYNYSYLRTQLFHDKMWKLTHRAIVREFERRTDLGVKAFIFKYRNDHGFHTRFRWCSDKMVLSMIYGEEM